MSITGRTHLEKVRLDGMTPEQREWRKKWLKDQTLSPREPILIPKDHPDLMNPIRRFYRKPLDVLFFKVLPIKNKDLAMALRYYTGKLLLGIYGAYATYYYFKYNTSSWESHSGWRVIKSRTAVYPGDPGYPAAPLKSKANEYADYGFKASPLSGGHIDTPRTAQL